jgi:hypothetical protein
MAAQQPGFGEHALDHAGGFNPFAAKARAQKPLLRRGSSAMGADNRPNHGRNIIDSPHVSLGQRAKIIPRRG